MSSEPSRYNAVQVSWMPFTGTGTDEWVAAWFCAPCLVSGNYVGFELFKNGTSSTNLAIHCLFAGALPSPLCPGILPLPTVGIVTYPQAGTGEIATTNSSPDSKCYKVSSPTTSPVTTASPGKIFRSRLRRGYFSLYF